MAHNGIHADASGKGTVAYCRYGIGNDCFLHAPAVLEGTFADPCRFAGDVGTEQAYTVLERPFAYGYQQGRKFYRLEASATGKDTVFNADPDALVLERHR